MTICNEMELGLAQQRLDRNASLMGWIAKFKTAWKLRRQQRIDRAAFKNLLTVDADILRDIGVTHGDVEWGVSLPLKCNAGQELEAIKLARKQVARKARDESDFVQKK